MANPLYIRCLNREIVVQKDKPISEIRALSEEDKLRLLDVILSELDKPDPAVELSSSLS